MNFIQIHCLIALGIMCYVAGDDHCPCKNKLDCEHPLKTDAVYEGNKEVYVFSRGFSNVQTWNWNTITTLVVPENFSITDDSQSNTMCLAHSKGRKFAITVTMNLSGVINASSNESISWITSVVSKQQSWHADVVVVDLIPYFKSDVNSTQEDHEQLAIVLKNVLAEIKKLSNYSSEINCIVPWRPPCTDLDAESCDFSTLSTDGCNKYIINPDSFTGVQGVKCRAKATIPLAKLLYGISEYVSHHVSFSSIILGVAWHGYDYLCVRKENDVCIVGEMNDCNKDRKRLSLADIMSSYEKEWTAAKYSDIYGAPYFDYKNVSVQHQVWFENRISLLSKYRMAHELNLKGVAVMYGDDLSTDQTPTVLVNDEDVWSWLTHEFILQVSKQPSKIDFHMADTVAAVAVACLLVGTFLGTLFTCLALKRKVKKPQQPFSRDSGPNVDDYFDEDPAL